MALTADQLIAEIETMTVLDLANLVKALEDRFGVSAAAMAVADGPRHGPLVRSAIVMSTAAAVRLNSWASTSQAPAAASIGPEPAPAYMRVELISGGSAP